MKELNDNHSGGATTLTDYEGFVNDDKGMFTLLNVYQNLTITTLTNLFTV